MKKIKLSNEEKTTSSFQEDCFALYFKSPTDIDRRRIFKINHKTSNYSKKRIFLWSLLISLIPLLVACTAEEKEDGITFKSLLKEMVDRERITQFPEIDYQTLQASSYNRASIAPDKQGWFADSDGVSWIRTEEINGKKEWVIMEDDGPGAITKMWAVCFYYGLGDTTGANINIYLDGAATPTISTNFFKLVKGQDFVKAPLADYTARAGNLYLPIPYAKGCKITMDKKAFYNIINYRKYPAGTKVKTFTMKDFDAASKTIAEVSKTLTKPADIKGVNKEAIIEPGKALTYEAPNGNYAIKNLKIKIGKATNMAQALRSIVLTAKFDRKQTIWAPIGDFFNNVGKVQAYNMWERAVQSDGTMICRWLMPYEKTGVITLENLGKEAVEVQLEVAAEPLDWSERSMHFYATWQMEDPTPTFPLYDWNFLTAKGEGLIVGDQWTVLNPIEGWWGEGDEKIYIDDDIERNFPSHFGTGTEDYYGWAGGRVPTPADEFSKPFLGNIIVGDRSKGYNVCTRTRVLDAIPFRKQIKFDIESSCGKRSKSHFLQYAQTTFWYGKSGITHNRPALPEFAAAKLPTVADLSERIKAAEAKKYFVENALEAEILNISEQKGVLEDFAEIPQWGELSNGEMKNLWFEKEGDFAIIKITEQFEKSFIKLGATVGKVAGKFNIYVNDQLKTTADLYSEHSGMTNPHIALGDCEPIDNAFTIKFEYLGAGKAGHAVKGRKALGLDFFLIENDFLKEREFK